MTQQPRPQNVAPQGPPPPGWQGGGPPTPPSKGRGSRTLIIVAAVLVVALLIGGAVFWALNRSSDDPASPRIVQGLDTEPEVEWETTASALADSIIHGAVERDDEGNVFAVDIDTETVAAYSLSTGERRWAYSYQGDQPVEDAWPVVGWAEGSSEVSVAWQGQIIMLDRETGEVRRSFQVEGAPPSPAGDGFVGTSESGDELIYYEANGDELTEQWRAPFEPRQGDLWGRWVVEDGVLSLQWVSGLYQRTYAYNIADGSTPAGYPKGSEHYFTLDGVQVSFDEHSVAATDGDRELWSVDGGYALAVGDDLFLVKGTARGTTVRKVDPRSGEEQWGYTTGSEGFQVFPVGDRVAVSDGEQIDVLDLESGEPVTSLMLADLDMPGFGRFFLGEDKLIVTGNEEDTERIEVLALDLDTGEVIWRTGFDGYHAAEVIDGRLHLVGDESVALLK